MSSERLVVTIGAAKPNYKAAALPNGKTVFVRKTTMRNGPAAWAQLATGDEVELEFKVCAGREIITDAIKLPAGVPRAAAAPGAGMRSAALMAPEPEPEPALAPAVGGAGAAAVGAGSDVEVQQLRAREAELEATILTDRRILMAGGLQCGCGCGPDDEGYDPWAPQPTAVGAFGVQQPKVSAHAEAKTAEVATRLELNQLELAELQALLLELDTQQSPAADAAGAPALDLAGRVRGGSDDEPEPEPEPEPPVYEDEDVIARPSHIEGIGLFANRDFMPGEVVVHWQPQVLTEEEFQTAGAICHCCLSLSSPPTF